MRLRYVIADVFTRHIFGGNQLAVFPHAANVPPELMQVIARELNLSETVFVLPASDPAHTRALRIFTPGMELPFAGHPTVGTACVLVSLGEVAASAAGTMIVFEEGVGPVQVSARSDRGALSAQFAVARLPEPGPAAPPAAQIAQMLSLTPAEIMGGDDAPQAWSAGVPFLLIRVRDRNALDRIKLNVAEWERTLRDFWAPHVYAFCLDDAQAPKLEHTLAESIRVRMFAPAMGITEDPATGAGAAALAGCLAGKISAADGSLRWRIMQGAHVGRPSVIELEADKSAGVMTSVRVGGECVVVGEGVLNIPD